MSFAERFMSQPVRTKEQAVFFSAAAGLRLSEVAHIVNGRCQGHDVRGLSRGAMCNAMHSWASAEMIQDVLAALRSAPRNNTK